MMISPYVGGTLIRSLVTCKTQLWYFSHGINLDYDNEDMLIGREIHSSGFARYLREKQIGPIKIDVFRKDLLVEVKKSGSNINATIWQTKYYLWYIKNVHGIHMKAKIYIPTEKKSIPVELDDGDGPIIEEMLKQIETIRSMKSPPKPEKKPLCRRCSYYDLCWS